VDAYELNMPGALRVASELIHPVTVGPFTSNHPPPCSLWARTVNTAPGAAVRRTVAVFAGSTRMLTQWAQYGADAAGKDGRTRQGKRAGGGSGTARGVLTVG